MVGRSVLGATPTDSYAEAGMYGSLGVPSTGNFPGSRSEATAWTDSFGNLLVEELEVVTQGADVVV
jgi:hypothetical protein